ncbi:MAG: carboxypeptidase regulatory-like domain-containing protein [Pyrinomonadaceae bacterium]
MVQRQAMFAKIRSHYLTPKSLGEARSGKIRLHEYRGRSAVYPFIWVGLCLIPFLSRNAGAVVPITPPILISQETSTRAIALDSLSFTSEPFALTSPYAAGSDRRTRVTLFAMNLSLQANEELSLVTADAEDATHQHYNLTVEYVGPVPQQEWLSAVVLRLSDNLGNVGDVLVRVSYRGSNSNRVRIGIGHLGGGPADDPGATPTPVRPLALSGQVRDDGNGLLAGVELTLTDTTDGTTNITTTSADGRFFFSVAPGHSFTVAPSATVFFNFNAQAVDRISGDRVLDFSGTRRTYSISGRLTGVINRTNGLTVNLSGSRTALTISNNNGDFVFAGLPAGRDYTIVVPTTPYYTFTATNLNNLSGNQVADFAGALRSYTVSGRAQLGPNAASGLVVQISGAQTLAITTDDDGRYSVSLPAGANYTITLSVPFWNFVPTVQVVTDLASDQINRNFTGFEQEFTISGKLIDQENNGLVGLTVNLTGREERTVVTDNTGHYEFARLFAGYNYAVTPPSTADYKFTGQTITQLSSDQTLNFTGLRRLILNGRVRDESGNGLLGITVNLSGTESGTAITAADGSYSLTATATGNYTVTPSISQDWYTFAPASEQFNNLAVGQTTDFTATLVRVSDPSYVLEFDGTPKTVDYGPFWPEGVNLGHFLWEFWAMPGPNAGATYMLSDGYGGAHALLFGVGSFNSSEVDRYELLGNIFDGARFDNYFGSDVGPAVGEWAHFAVGWDGQNIITYYNGVPVGKTPFSGPRRTPGPGGGGGRLLIGGSDHSNFDGRIAQVRGYEDTNPREGLPGSVEASFAPQTVFGLGGNLLSYYFRPSPRLIADLSQGYRGISHPGFRRGTGTGIIYYCESCPPPQFVIDPTAPNFVTGSPPSPVNVPPFVAPPGGALVFDSFSRANSTYTFGANGGLGSTESGSAGTQVWQTNQAPASPQPFGILNARAVLLANSTAVAWVPTGAASGNADVRVNRYAGRWGSGIHTGLSFRVADANNFFFAYTAETGGTPNSKTVHVGYYLNGQRLDLTNGVAMPSSWTTLRVVTTNSGDIRVYVDSTLVYSTINPLLGSANGAGLYSDSAGTGLVNRWDNFTVLNAP